MDENDSCTHLLLRLISFQMTVAKKLACESQWVKWKMWKQSWDFPTFKNSQSHLAVLWHLETLPTVPAMSVGDACRHLAENGAAQMVQYRSSMFVLGLPKTICFVKVTVWAWADLGRIPLIFFVLGEFGRFGSPTINSWGAIWKTELEIDLVSDSSCKKSCLRIAMSKGKQSWDFRTFKIHKVEAMRHLCTLPTVPAMSVKKRTLVPL